jgi:hypothetical protein
MIEKVVARSLIASKFRNRTLRAIAKLEAPMTLFEIKFMPILMSLTFQNPISSRMGTRTESEAPTAKLPLIHFPIESVPIWAASMLPEFMIRDVDSTLAAPMNQKLISWSCRLLETAILRVQLISVIQMKSC